MSCSCNVESVCIDLILVILKLGVTCYRKFDKTMVLTYTSNYGSHRNHPEYLMHFL